MKYDDAAWHYEGDFPADLAPERAATHIGMFLQWAIETGLLNNEHVIESPDEVRAVLNGEMTGAEFLLEVCDEKLTSDDFSEVGNIFVGDYYEEHYTDDYAKILGDTITENQSLYHIEDTRENYEKVKAVIDARFKVE